MERRPGGRRPAFWIWTSVIAVVVVGVVVGVFWVTGEPWFCATCHEMQPEVKGWEAGTHKEVSCFACHSEPGLIGYLKAHVGQGLQDVWVHTTSPPAKIVPTPNAVPPERCLACHTDTKHDNVPAFPSAAEFPNHPPKTADCPECHRDQIHGPKP
jgi:hypothetical protein